MWCDKESDYGSDLFVSTRVTELCGQMKCIKRHLVVSEYHISECL